MKKLPQILLTASLSLPLALAGCNQTQNAGNSVADEASNAVNSAATTANDIISDALASQSGGPANADTEGTVSSVIITNDRSPIGRVTLTQMDDYVKVYVVVEAGNIAPGLHGVHFHQVADCSDEGFLNTKAHINPMGHQHGLKNPDGPDNADLPNLVANASGFVNQTVTTTMLSLTGNGEHQPAIFDADGSALVIHANPDDQITQPIGGAGPRIGCAEFK